MSTRRARVSLMMAGAAALVLSGCASGVQTRTVAAPEQLQPLPASQVETANLPAIGQSGAVTIGQMPAPPGGNMVPMPGAQPAPVDPLTPGAPLQTATIGGNANTLSVGGGAGTPGGRDLSGGLTVEKLLGGWNVVSGADQCRLNLTFTLKDGTSRYRASAPGCTMPGIGVVAAWQLAGNQVQLFDENNDMIAALILSGNQFIGTLAGGRGVAMVG